MNIFICRRTQRMVPILSGEPHGSQCCQQIVATGPLPPHGCMPVGVERILSWSVSDMTKAVLRKGDLGSNPHTKFSQTNEVLWRQPAQVSRYHSRAEHCAFSKMSEWQITEIKHTGIFM